MVIEIFQYKIIYILISILKKKLVQLLLQHLIAKKQMEVKMSIFTIMLQQNFKGWKELKISLSEYTKNNSHDLSKLTSLCFHSKGQSQITDPTSIIYIDKFYFVKSKFD